MESSISFHDPILLIHKMLVLFILMIFSINILYVHNHDLLSIKNHFISRIERLFEFPQNVFIDFAEFSDKSFLKKAI